MSLRRPADLADLLAALSIAGLLLPEAVAYSGLANLPPQAGVIGLSAGLLCPGDAVEIMPILALPGNTSG